MPRLPLDAATRPVFFFGFDPALAAASGQAAAVTPVCTAPVVRQHGYRGEPKYGTVNTIIHLLVVLLQEGKVERDGTSSVLSLLRGTCSMIYYRGLPSRLPPTANYSSDTFVLPSSGGKRESASSRNPDRFAPRVEVG